LIVIDACAVCELLFRGAAERRLVELVLGDRASVHAPDLVNVEVLHGIRRMTVTGAITVRRADEMRDDLADLPIHCYPSRPLLDRAWALRDNLTVYDAVYVALAEALDATLVTADHALARAAAQASNVSVETVS
jgi:predicted nucleic acid-binding protein